MDEKDRNALAATIAKLPQDKLDEIEALARKTLAGLEDANSAYPATRAFLQARGLVNVRQLDKQGMQELRTHLEETLRSLCKAKE